MIDYENLFKRQMQDFHGMYTVQKPLMNLKNTRDELFPLKRMFTESRSVGSSRFLLGEPFLKDQDLCSRFQPGPLDLRLSMGQSCNDYILDDEEVNLSLSIGRTTYKRSRISTKSWNNKIVYPSPQQDIIDLKESNEYARPVFSMGQSFQKLTDHSTPYSSWFLMNNGNFQQDSMKIEQSYRKRESSKKSVVFQEWSSLNQGSMASHDLKRTKLLDLDLNKSLPDESFLPSNKSFGESCSNIDKPAEVSISSIPKSKQPESQTSPKDGQTKARTINLESLPEPTSDLTVENTIHISKVREQKEKEDFDHTVRKAALSLISISMQQIRPDNQDSEPKLVSNEIQKTDEIKKKTIQRSSSIDSYESLVLKIQESSLDEDSATSKAFEINESGQKENGIRLRRGSRLKDFQKDILPIISTLSQHEILEDINILEGVIRSREYRRLNKSKIVKGENGSKPVRSKRLKVNYAGRRCSLRK